MLFIDLETTGLYPERGHRIWEAAIFDAGGLRYHRGISPDVAEMTETDEKAMVGELLATIADQVVVGHNIPFDLRFIDERARRLDVRSSAVGFIDTLGLARRALDDSDEKLTLEYVAECLSLVIPEKLHRAAPDARLARDVFWKLVKRRQFVTLADVRVRRFECHDK